MLMRIGPLAAMILLAACSAPVSHETKATPAPADTRWTLSNAAAGLAQQSCANPSAYVSPTNIEIQAEPVPLGPEPDASDRLPAGVTFAGGWVLTSPDKFFGGLSGLVVLPDGDLLTVADIGEFVWIGMKNGKPDGTGQQMWMLGQDGKELKGKREGDSEGLAVWHDLALVSFERDHRISAFALNACGAAAREALIANLPAAYEGQKIETNLGAEALATTPEGGIRFGIEHLENGQSPIGEVSDDGQAAWTGKLAHDPHEYSFVGMDQIVVAGKTETYRLFRDWDPVRGSRAIIRLPSSKEIVITKPLNRDNFEGIAAQPLPDGTVRVWIIADDNFSPSQRTLLFAFDVAQTAQ